MDTDLKDPMQEAADEAGGFEGLRLRHNCKEGVVYLDGVPVESEALRVVFLMETATHGWLEFDEAKKLVGSSVKRYIDVKPDRNECSPPRKPNTACLGVIESTGQILTYTGSSWSVRSAFTVQLLKPYARARKFGSFPVVSLGFKPGQKDDYGNFMPDFVITGWTPRSRFAQILGEGDPLIAISDTSERQPQLAAPAAPSQAPVEAPRRMQTVTRGGRRDGSNPPPIGDYPGPTTRPGDDYGDGDL
jgi:hypothetical protein